MDLTGVEIELSIEDDTVKMSSNELIMPKLALDEVPTLKPLLSLGGGRWEYTVALKPVPVVSLRDKVVDARKEGAVIKYMDDEVREKLKDVSAECPIPHAYWDADRQRVVVEAPGTPTMKKLMRRSGGTPRKDGSWSLPTIKVRDFLIMNDDLPLRRRVVIDDSVRDAVAESLPEPYDGTAESLRHIPLSALRTVRENSQSWAMLKADRSNIETKFHKMGVDSLYDLLMLRPRRYIDRSNPQDVRDLIEGETAVIVGKVTQWKDPSPKLLVLCLEDQRGVEISCSFFNANWMRTKFNPGDEVIAVGTYKPWRPAHGGKVYPQLAQPTIDPIEAAGALPIMPVYSVPAKAALSSTIVMHCEQELISRLGDDFRGPKWADPALEKNGITSMQYGDALKTMQLPQSTDGMDEARFALAFCEMVELLVWIESQRSGVSYGDGVPNRSKGEYVKAYRESLPYALTGAQDRAVAAIAEDMGSTRPMQALLVGDVGSGKTTVMHMAALMAAEAGHQAVVCAPTEILATQLYDGFMKVLDKMPDEVKKGIHPILHAGYKGKGSTARKRANVASVKDGTANMVFGTHSVLNLDYHDLSFVGVDEQHKFGAEQRSRLLEVREDGRTPDMLMQTATPIPRSMAQVYYGDIQYLRLDEMPAGRQPIKTVWVKTKGQTLVEESDSPIWKDVADEASKGHGTFVVCPMVADSEKVDAASVKATAEALKKNVFDGKLRVEAVYGGQAKDKQESVIAGFKEGTVDVLVASSVVEVGVSCEKATRMVILDANRFGMASLHQIRGRIGRSDLASKCWLVAMPFNDSGQQRMESMVDTLDGWKLSKADLRTRGSGSLFGTRQSGKSDLVFADLIGDAKWIDPARETAKSLLAGADADEAVDDARKYFGLDEGQSILA